MNPVPDVDVEIITLETKGHHDIGYNIEKGQFDSCVNIMKTKLTEFLEGLTLI